MLQLPIYYMSKYEISIGRETKHIHASAANLLHIRIGNLDWNKSHEKETKHIHASAADLLHIRIGNLNGCKCRLEKTKQEKYIVFVVEKWMQCLLFRLKSRSAREASRHPVFMGNCLTVSDRRYLYLSGR